MSPTLEQLYSLVKRVPAGSVVAYSDLGKALERPVSGYLVGRWMASAPAELPWWRVVAKSGDLVVGKRDPAIAAEQRRLLEREGVRFDGDRVAAEAFTDPDLLD